MLKMLASHMLVDFRNGASALRTIPSERFSPLPQPQSQQTVGCPRDLSTLSARTLVRHRKHGVELAMKRHISAPVGAQIVIVAPAASCLHVYADVVPSLRSETASIAWRSAQFPSNPLASPRLVARPGAGQVCGSKFSIPLPSAIPNPLVGEFPAFAMLILGTTGTEWVWSEDPARRLLIVQT